MKTNQIQIQPIRLWIKDNGLTTIDKIEVLKIVYTEGTAVARCQFIIDESVLAQIAANKLIAGNTTPNKPHGIAVSLTEEDCSTWVDDLEFYKLIVRKAGFSLPQ